MAIVQSHIRERLRRAEFRELFRDLGWDHYSTTLEFELASGRYTLVGQAEKRGMAVFVCRAGASGRPPDAATRRKIEKRVAADIHEHIIIYIDAAGTTQVWQWVKREPGKPDRPREITLYPGQSGEPLLQRLSSITFTLQEEDRLSIVDVAGRVRAAFDVDRLTKRFYDRFKTEHDRFLGFIQGITEQGDREWYASLMLNRLMFIYFIQKKGFLAGDRDYLRNRLRMVQQRRGKDQFLSFYRYFLIRLFHEGLGQPERERAPDLEALIGDVKYLNGGLFDLHKLEQQYAEIDIPDDAFERIFDFFDRYEWHLDTRPLRNDNEINPDVLGYIFEKYVNQKQMGAYYTKEDITGYISRNTVIPFLFDDARKRCAIAFEPGSSVWALLQDNPDRYIYEAVRKGVDLDLAVNIAAGIDDVSKRQDWNRPADVDHALPTETWREYMARRQRCHDLRHKLAAGEVADINDLITYNLDINQFALDVIDDCEGPDLLRAFYKAITSITILDPTCGSGAFLFAALNILEPLYDACLDRMQSFADELGRSEGSHSPRKFQDFRDTLAAVDRHPSREYFVLKSIIVNNLFGVDIMEEAVEIAKLRLFLKLVAQLESPDQIEPLPDVDFNITAGNTVVGFCSYDEVRRAIGRGLDFDGTMVQIDRRADDVGRLFQHFRSQQTVHGGDVTPGDKAELHRRLSNLRDQLDRYLASEYIADPGSQSEFRQWKDNHRPFHWFITFYGVMKDGGFDIVIGNPPYLERTKLAGQYKPLGLRTCDSRDIYAWFVERSVVLRNPAGRLGLIIPVSFASAEAFKILRTTVSGTGSNLWLSHFANRPGQLFSGAQNRLTILLSGPAQHKPAIASTRYHRWDAKGGERESLFDGIEYARLDGILRGFHGLFPKVGPATPQGVLHHLLRQRGVLGEYADRFGTRSLYWVRVPGYFCQFFLKPPKARPEAGGVERMRGEVLSVRVRTSEMLRVLHAILNSSVYYFFFCAYTDGRHVNPSDVGQFPLDLRRFGDGSRGSLNALSVQLERSMASNTTQHRKSGLLIDSVDSRQSKPILDCIDRILAQEFGFSDEELDFVLNYDIKYRMGGDAEE